MDYVIEIDNVTKDFKGAKLDNISIKVPKGSVCGFIGQNGAGKTTTIKLILDIINRDSGDIKVFGKDVLKEGHIIKDDIGVVYDEMGFHDFMTGMQINKMLKNIYSKWDEEQFFSYMKRFGLPLNRKCGAFSRGMQMKLQIATALSHKAKLLIMDEPTSGLDPIVRNEIVQIFMEFAKDKEHTIFMSSHITSDLEKIADEVVFINNGKIILAGNKEKIMKDNSSISDNLEEIFIHYVNEQNKN